MQNKNLLVLVPDYPDEHNKMIGSLFVKEQVTYLSKYFDNVYVIAPVLKAFGMTMQSHYCKDYKIGNISVFFPSCLFYPRAINLFPVSNYTKLSFDNRYSVIRKTIKENNLKFDLIHSHMTFPATYAACKLKEEYHVPVVATIHEDSGWLQEEILMNHEKINYAWKNADVLIRVNKTEIPFLKVYNNDVRYIPNGFTDTYMPLNQNLCRDLLNLDRNQKFVFAYGAFDERKGFQTLIKAMSYIKTSNIKCYISGRGPYEPYLHNDIIGLGLTGQVKLLNFMSDIALCNWINASDLFIFPSLRESFGIVQINAMACGIPVIASANVGSNEVLCPACGELYNVGDAKDLASTITHNINKQWDHKGIRKYAELHYSWEGVVNQLINLYEELL
jgi:teichuronic acid biosynthesis glycosyltransferase TuaC